MRDFLKVFGMAGLLKGDPVQILFQAVSFVTRPMLEGALEEKLARLKAARRKEIAESLRRTAEALATDRTADAAATLATLIGGIRL